MSDGAQQRGDLTDSELSAEIVALIRQRAVNDYHAYSALLQAAVDLGGPLQLLARLGSFIRIGSGGEL
jgi:hypothetical protein